MNLQRVPSPQRARARTLRTASDRCRTRHRRSARPTSTARPRATARRERADQYHRSWGTSRQREQNWGLLLVQQSPLSGLQAARGMSKKAPQRPPGAPPAPPAPTYVAEPSKTPGIAGGAKRPPGPPAGLPPSKAGARYSLRTPTRASLSPTRPNRRNRAFARARRCGRGGQSAEASARRPASRKCPAIPYSRQGAAVAAAAGRASPPWVHGGAVWRGGRGGADGICAGGRRDQTSARRAAGCGRRARGPRARRSVRNDRGWRGWRAVERGGQKSAAREGRRPRSGEAPDEGWPPTRCLAASREGAAKQGDVRGGDRSTCR